MANLRLSVLSLLVVGALHAEVAAQSPPATTGATRADTMHLTLRTFIDEARVAAPNQVSLTFDITPKKLMHVYAPGKHDYQVIAVKLDAQPWFRVSPTTYPPSEIYHFKELDEKVETYGKPFTLVQQVIILATPEAKTLLAASPTVTISGRLEYQACDDRVCYAPTKVPVRFTLNVADLAQN